MRVVLDTNALMMPVESDVRLFDELERLLDDPTCLVPEAVASELESLSTGSGDEAAAAEVGLDLLSRCECRQTDASYADDAVLQLADELEVPAVTNDQALRDRLLDEDVSVIGLRGKNKLALTQP